MATWNTDSSLNGNGWEEAITDKMNEKGSLGAFYFEILKFKYFKFKFLKKTGYF